jgi:glutathione S-transferase
VLDHDGFRIIEPSAIAPYLDEALPGPSFTPDNPQDCARMRVTMGIGGFHLFPDFIGGPNEDPRRQSIAPTRRRGADRLPQPEALTGGPGQEAAFRGAPLRHPPLSLRAA